MVKDLVGTTYEDYDAWLEEGEGAEEHVEEESPKAQESPKGKGKKGKDKEGRSKGGKKGGEYNDVVDIDKSDRGFSFKGKLIGDKGKYIHHIQDQTRAKLWIEGDDGDS